MPKSFQWGRVSRQLSPCVAPRLAQLKRESSQSTGNTAAAALVVHRGSTTSKRQMVLAAARKTQPQPLLARAAVLSQTLSFKQKELYFKHCWGLETSFFPFIENQAEKALAEVVQKADTASCIAGSRSTGMQSFTATEAAPAGLECVGDAEVTNRGCFPLPP